MSAARPECYVRKQNRFKPNRLRALFRKPMATLLYRIGRTYFVDFNRKIHRGQTPEEAIGKALGFASEKFCPGCDSNLPIDRFNVARSRPDGRQGYCRECSGGYPKK